MKEEILNWIQGLYRRDGVDGVNEGLNITDNEYVPDDDQKYPMSAERELARVNLTYMNSIIKMSIPYLVQVMNEYEKQSRADSRFDDFSSFRDKVEDVFEQISGKINEMSHDALRNMVVRAGNIAFKNSFKEWTRVMKNTFGARPMEKYYQKYMQATMEQWVDQNVEKITQLPEDYKQKVQDAILWGYETKQPWVNIYNRIRKDANTSKSYARILARDQMGTLNAQMTRKEHESMGVSKYVWKTKGDSKVRACHKELNNKVFAWNNPPEMWYETKHGIVFSGRRCNPGEDYMCRCTAIPVFEKDKSVQMFNEQMFNDEQQQQQ